jgi:hypothetical protein
LSDQHSSADGTGVIITWPGFIERDTREMSWEPTDLAPGAVRKVLDRDDAGMPRVQLAYLPPGDGPREIDTGHNFAFVLSGGLLIGAETGKPLAAGMGCLIHQAKKGPLTALVEETGATVITWLLHSGQ